MEKHGYLWNIMGLGLGSIRLWAETIFIHTYLGFLKPRKSLIFYFHKVKNIL